MSIHPNKLRVSIVCYASNIPALAQTLATLCIAADEIVSTGRLSCVDVQLVDNGPGVAEHRQLLALIEDTAAHSRPGISLSIAGDGRNIGFGRGHNLSFDPSSYEFHLVLNPDVELAADTLTAAFAFMDANPDCGLLAPAITGSDGAPQYLCKRYPAVFDLLLRGFAPAILQKLFQRRLFRYEMRDLIADTTVWNPPIISGCFMLLRASLLERLQGFDPRYFLYFEDFDLSLRATRWSRSAYVPTVRIVHHGGYAARKGWRHIYLFVRSASAFFSQHGWRWL